MLNWYRISRLLDTDPLEDQETYIKCMECGRFVTYDPYDSEQKRIWKLIEEMSPDERQEAEKALQGFSEGYKSKIGISHSYCPECEEKMLSNIGCKIDTIRKFARELTDDEFEEITKPKWINIDSSFIYAVAYHEPLQMFEVRLKDGREYSYKGVPKRVFNQFMKAESKGAFFNKVIKQYTHEEKNR